MTNSGSRALAFLAWILAAYSFTAIILISVGGVSWPLRSRSSQSNLGNPGFEILEWYLNGSGTTSIANYYHYRLYLNRICAVNSSKRRGLGDCFNKGVLGSFFVSYGDPDSYVRDEDAFDPVVGSIDFATPLSFYSFAAAALVCSLLLLPTTIIAGDSSPTSPRHARWSTWCAGHMMAAALCLLVSSTALTSEQHRVSNKMEEIPQVTHVWRGHIPIALTWSATASTIVAALALSRSLFRARQVVRRDEMRRILLMDD